MFGVNVDVPALLGLPQDPKPADISVEIRLDLTEPDNATALHDVPAPEVRGRLMVKQSANALWVSYGTWLAHWRRDERCILLNTDEPAVLIPLLERVIMPLVLLTTGGRLALHGSAVVIEDRGWCILGPSGHGKSTLAMVLLERGGKLLCDDVAIIDADMKVLPGLGVIRSFSETLPVDSEPLQLDRREKYLHLLSANLCARNPAPLSGILLLAGPPAPEPMQLSGSQRLTALLGNRLIFQNLSAAETQAEIQRAAAVARSSVPIIQIGSKPDLKRAAGVIDDVLSTD